MKQFFFISIYYFLLLSNVNLFAISTQILPSDSIIRKPSSTIIKYSHPRIPTIMSAILPGLGQFYNKKLWKVPIIYSGLIGFGYYYKINNEEYNKYRLSLIAYYDNDPSTIPAITNYSGEQLQSLKLSYKKSRDLAAIGLVIVYLFNIIDANVDGHLKSFDVSDDLSLKIDPWQNIYQDSYNNYNTSLGLSIKLNFK